MKIFEMEQRLRVAKRAKLFGISPDDIWPLILEMDSDKLFELDTALFRPPALFDLHARSQRAERERPQKSKFE